MMSDYAQKRDVADPATVAAFAKIVETPERLRLLLVLTIADIRAVGPGVWNGWKGQLLRELYGAAETVFRGGRTSDAAGLARRRQERIAFDARTALVERDPEARAWANAMEDAYFASFGQDDQRRHRALSLRASENAGAAAKAVIRADRDAAEVVVAARDRRGLFADLAMTISALGGNVVGARIFTSSNQEALDIFYVQDSGGQPFGGAHADRLGRLERALEAAARGEPGLVSDREAPVFGRASAFAIAATVTVDNDASQDSTVIEASGRDRPRLLEALARTLSEADLSIQSAHVDGHGERAVDAFYIVDSKGAKLTHRKRVGAVRTRLLEVLEAADPGSKPRRLPTARASPAR